MNLIELVNKNVSKKWGALFATILGITQAKDENQAWQIVIVSVVYFIVQGVLDWRKGDENAVAPQSN